MSESTGSNPPSSREDIIKQQTRVSQPEYADLTHVTKVAESVATEAHKQIATDDICEPYLFEGNQTEANEDLEREIKNSLIYVVDDEEGITKLLKRILAMGGFKKVRIFNDGDEVKAAIFGKDGAINELPVLIISDTEMGRMNGPELYRALQSLPEDKRPAVLASSGKDSSKELWGDSVLFMSKPFVSKEMESAVRRLLTEKLSRR